MIPAAFDYDRPATLDDALGLLDHHRDAMVLAGGQSLLPLLKLRMASVGRLIDIGRIAELRGIRDRDGGVAIGALTTYREVLDSALVHERFPMLMAAIEGIGDVQVRNRGTIGGALAHADPASDVPALALALDADIVLRSRSGERIVPARDFCQGAFRTACKPGEILAEVRLPALPAGAGSAYRNLEQPASGYSIVGVAAVVAMSHDRVSHVRVGITGVGEIAYRATRVEADLLGSDGGPHVVMDAANHAADGIEVASDIHADRAYRTEMAKVFTRRALEAAFGRE
jgi:carbon-monoxide dehydrogenase medium subunit